MGKAIQIVNETTFKLSARGNDYTLVREKNEWAMYVVNASVRAWRNGFAIPKYFKTLKDVEAKYKSWLGISELTDDIRTANYKVGQPISVTNNEGTEDYKILAIHSDFMQLSRLSDQWLVSLYEENYHLINNTSEKGKVS